MKRLLISAVSCVVLVGCSMNPRDVEIPGVGMEQFSDKKFTRAMNKLTDEERRMVNGYIFLSRGSNEPIEKGFTIGNAIDFMIQYRQSTWGTF